MKRIRLLLMFSCAVLRGEANGLLRIRSSESAKSILSQHLKASRIATSRSLLPRGGSLSGDSAVQDEEEGVTTLKMADSDETLGKGALGDSLGEISSVSSAAELSDEALQKATDLRQKGKDLHDQGDWAEAANVFAEAGRLLQPPLEDDSEYWDSENYVTDYCTCRLHEALCRLKMDDHDACVDVCTSILNLPQDTSAAIRAKAYHRRAKAHLYLGHDEEALQDARSAAFLGDHKAVTLYGKLMRGNSKYDDLASPPLLNDLLQGKNPFLSTSSSTGEGSSSMSASSSALFESLMSKSSPMLDGEMPSLLGQGGAGGTLAKSLLTSLTSRLENDSDSLCQYLQQTSPLQIQQFGAMAGLPISESQAQRLTGFCHSVTPKSIRRTVKLSKLAFYVFKLMRKTMKVINKYKHFLVLWGLVVWVQSALRRPIPIAKKAAKLASAKAG
jgi:tetratricopeptide (TPR) repeat protein